MAKIKSTPVPFIKRLHSAVDQCDKYKKPMQRVINRMMEHYANGWYKGSDGSRTAQPLNMIDRGIQTLIPFLVSNNPRVQIRPRAGVSHPGIKPFAKTLELALTHLLDEIKFASYTLTPIVMDSLFSMGISKTGTMHSHTVEVGGYLHDVGQPYSDRVDFADYIFDISARNPQEMKWQGNRYRMDYDYVMQSNLFKHTDKLKPDQAAHGSREHPDYISRDGKTYFNYNELHKTVELIDLWLPNENIIVTIPKEGQGSNILRTVEWDGPETGPYDLLAYKMFPGTTVPVPPIYTWLDINKAINTMVCKMRDMIDREKTVGVYDLMNAEDGQVVKTANHGDLIGLRGGADSVKEVTFGGFNPQSLQFLMFMIDQFSKSGPNLEQLGGRGVMADTLGQEQMMQQNALREVDHMINMVYEFTRSVVRKLTWFLWTDPLITTPLIKRIGEFEYDVEYSQYNQEGDFFDYALEIEPYSMSRMNPEMRYQKILQLVNQMIIPLLPIAMQQGNYMDVNSLVKEVAPYLGIANVDDWWKSIVPQQGDTGPYQPLQGQVVAKSGQDQRGALGQAPASKAANLNQQQARNAGQSSKA